MTKTTELTPAPVDVSAPPPAPSDAPVAALVQAAGPASASDQVHEFPMLLEEFCTAHSKVERGVELLSAFFAIETAAGRYLAMPSEFRARLADFANRPCG